MEFYPKPYFCPKCKKNLEEKEVKTDEDRGLKYCKICGMQVFKRREVE